LRNASSRKIIRSFAQGQQAAHKGQLEAMGKQACLYPNSHLSARPAYLPIPACRYTYAFPPAPTPHHNGHSAVPSLHTPCPHPLHTRSPERHVSLCAPSGGPPLL
jgi:hypothetical protein